MASQRVNEKHAASSLNCDFKATPKSALA